MKKLLIILFLFQIGLIIGQTETIVTINGKKVTFNPSHINFVENGLTNSTPTNVQLGGVLTKATVLATTNTFTLAIKGLATKGSFDQLTDNIMMSDNNGTLKTLSLDLLSTEPWYDMASNTHATQNTQNIYIMGNVGIGQNTTTTKLDIKGTVKIADNSQAANYVLTSDANGAATWKLNQPEIGYIKGALPQTQVNLDSAGIIYFGSSIGLPPGNWMIYAGILINPKIGLTICEPNTNYVARFTISDSSTSLSSSTFSFLTTNKFFFGIANTGLSPTPKALFNMGCVRVKTTLPSTTLYLLSNGMGTAIGSVDKNDQENFFYALRFE